MTTSSSDVARLVIKVILLMHYTRKPFRLNRLQLINEFCCPSEYKASPIVIFNVAVTGKWQQLKPTGDKLPCLQEHTTVAYRDCIYVFGGEVGFSAGTETPLWVYDIRANTWKKKRTKKGE